jgi:dipeptidyl aminopeptidase/acylaminoacyl peptidase
VAGLGVLDIDTGQLVEMQPAPAAVGAVAAGSGLVACVLGRSDAPAALVCFDPARLDDPAALQVVRQASIVRLPAAGISVARPVSWPSLDDATAHGYFYPPANAEVDGPPDERPPLLVLSHGGPTSATSPAMSLSVQFWTSRGFAVLDVNYGGSTGYGRAYRDRLAGRWGIVDVADCCTGARYAADQGWVDPARMAIKGGSAGGYTTLAALTFTDVFTAGVSRYGIGDLEALARDTHKFESRYLDGLVGPYPAAAQVYRERSPIHHVDRLDCALLLLQGTEDRVVPPAQAVEMAAAVRAKGKPVALVLLEGEGHGFRQRANVERAIDAELYFYGRVFGFTPAGVDTAAPPPIDIQNSPTEASA